jgi:amino-acid N-acetyltransferase
MRIYNAMLPDVPAIHDVIAYYSQDGTLLARDVAELSENIRDFLVAEEDGVFLGCGALHLYGTHLAEVRSIAVWPQCKGMGAGRRLLEGLLAEARQHGVNCVCMFTRLPDFFAHMGFRPVEKTELPDKIYKDCVNCPRLENCDEVAMYRGKLPGFAILPRPEKGLENFPI